MRRATTFLAGLGACMFGGIGWAQAQDCDIAILNGRVMDPETRFDAVRNVCVKDGMICLLYTSDAADE